MRVSFVAAAAVLPVALLAPSVAEAEISAGLGLNLFTRSGATLISPDMRVVFPVPVLPTMHGEVAWSFATLAGDDPSLGSIGSEGISEFSALNPYFAAHFGFDFELVKLFVGGGIAFPIANFNATSDAVIYTRNLGMRGAWRPWIYAPDSFSFVAPATFEFDVPGLELMAEAAVFAMISTGDGSDTEVGLQLAGEAALPILVLLDLGLRVQVVYLDIDRSADAMGIVQTVKSGNAHVSAEPFAQFKLGPVKARLGFLLNFARPLGFSFDSGRVWGLRASGALTF